MKRPYHIGILWAARKSEKMGLSQILCKLHIGANGAKFLPERLRNSCRKSVFFVQNMHIIMDKYAVKLNPYTCFRLKYPARH